MNSDRGSVVEIKQETPSIESPCQGLRMMMPKSRCPPQPRYTPQPHPDLPVCVNCDQMFPDRMWLEEHSCPAVKYICSCGTEFSTYTDMLQHSLGHEPGHTGVKKFQKEENQGGWTADDGHATPSSPMLSSLTVPLLSSPGPSSPAVLSASTPQAPAFPPGVPVVDFWYQYQPVVLIETLRKFDEKKAFTCARCEQGFQEKKKLILHHNLHIRTKVAGCLRCGLLLVGSKTAPDHHQCDPAGATAQSRFSRAVVVRERKPMRLYRCQRCPATFTQELQLRRHLTSEKSACRKVVIGSVLGTSGRYMSWSTAPTAVAATGASGNQRVTGHMCGVCHELYPSVPLLQRHKCQAAAEFLQRQQPNGRPRASTSTYSLPPRNGDKERAWNIQASRSVRPPPPQQHHRAVVTVKTEEESDDDCYVIENSSAKPSQLFYHKLPSGLPGLKT